MNLDKQKIGFWSLVSLVTGNLVGSGVFLLPTTLVQFGSISILAWVITSLGAILLALIFAELVSVLPKNGGPYVFIQQAFGKTIGFFTAWGYWILSWVSNAALIVGAAGYFSMLAGNLGKFDTFIVEMVIFAIIIILNLFGLKASAKGELILTVIKIIPLIMIPLIGVFWIDFSNFPAFNLTSTSTLSALNSVAFITLWGFLGVETGTVPANQVVNPQRVIPLATITGTLIAAVIYILGTVVIFGLVPTAQLAVSTAPYAEAGAVIFGGSWGKLVILAAIITCVGSLNGWTIVVGRTAQAAASDGLFPKVFGKVNNDGTPVNATLISSFLTMMFVVLSLKEDVLTQFNFVIDVSITFLLIIYLMCILAFFKLVVPISKKRKYHYCVGGSSLIFVLWALYALKWDMLVYSILMVGSGIPVYYLKSKN